MKARFSIFLLTVCFSTTLFSQQKEPQRIINTIPLKVPVKVEIINGGMMSPLDAIEIKVTNIGTKPIYFFDMSISTEKEFAPRNYVGFSSFRIGNVRLYDFSRPFDSLTAERAETTPFESGETAVFRITKKEAELSWKLMMDYGYPQNSRLIFYMTHLRFGDGTGYVTPQAVEMSDPRPASSNSPPKPSMSFFLRR